MSIHSKIKIAPLFLDKSSARHSTHSNRTLTTLSAPTSKYWILSETATKKLKTVSAAGIDNKRQSARKGWFESSIWGFCIVPAEPLAPVEPSFDVDSFPRRNQPGAFCSATSKSNKQLELIGPRDSLPSPSSNRGQVIKTAPSCSDRLSQLPASSLDSTRKGHDRIATRRRPVHGFLSS